MDRNAWTRRDVLRLAAAGSVAVAGGIAMAGAEKREIPIGLQLYSVRHECARDLDATVAKVAEMGYQGVEFAGYYGRTARELRGLLERNGLKCCGTHIGLDTLLGDELQKTVDFNLELGNPYLIVPWLPEERWKTKETILQTAQIFNEIAGKLQPHGLRVGYHNHHFEFQKIGGETIWDLFFSNTDPSVIMQFDTGNGMMGGADPSEYIRRYPGRAVTVHVKEFSRSDPAAYIGEGDIDWPAMFRLLSEVGGTQWYIIEYEHESKPALESVARCLDNVKRILRRA